MQTRTVKLAEVAEVFNGKTPSKNEQRDTGYPVLKIKDVTEDAKFKGVFESFVDEEFVGKHSSKKICADDTLILNAAHNADYVGTKQYRVEPEIAGAIATGEWLIVRGDNKNLDPKYVSYWLRNSETRFHMKGLVKGIHLYPKDVARLQIPLPSLSEQKRIAAILDKADAIRSKRQQAIQLADQFLRAVFLELFGDPVTNPKGWEEFILKDVADIRSGVTKGKKVDPAIAVTLPYMRVANVQDGYLDLDDVKDITVSPADAEKCRLMGGDILLTEGRDPDKLGRGYVWHEEIKNCIHQNHIFSVRIHDQDKINPLFLSALIGSQRGKRYFLKVGKQTTGIATINKTVLSEFVPFIPPYELQVKYVSVVNKVKGVKQKQKLLYTGLFESLSQRAFSGEL